MKLTLGFGKTDQTLSLPDQNIQDILLPRHYALTCVGEQEVERALSHPIASAPLEALACGKRRVAVITSDLTRPMPSRLVLPCVLRRLERAGVRKSEITIVIALGSHRAQTRREMEQLLGGEIAREYRCVNSSEEAFIHLGTTRRGTPVDLAESVARADFIICLGNIEYHYFAGYSGGAKALMPGVSTRTAIQANHSRMVEESACAGKLDGNPVREDIEEAAAIKGIDFLLNVVLDEKKQVVRAVAGDWKLAHREGCRFLDAMYHEKISRKADIVIVSQGGAPKDINLYQTQKALENAQHAVRTGGIIILVGACGEGMGEAVFESWMVQARTPDEIIERIQRDFQLGGHKAAAIALVLKKAQIFLVSEMDADFVRSIFLKPFRDVQSAAQEALRQMGEGASVLVMPYGGSVLPCLGESAQTAR